MAAVECTQAQSTSDPLPKETETFAPEQMKKARDDCARKLAVTELPDNDNDLIAHYGLEKWGAFKDCVREELHLDVQHPLSNK